MKTLHFIRNVSKNLKKRPRLLLIILVSLLCLQACEKNTITIHPLTTTTGASAAVTGAANLSLWAKYKANPSNTSFNWMIIGDSYTAGDYYTWQLHDKLLGDGYADGGPGYCSFSRYDTTSAASIDQSIEPAELSTSYDLGVWNFTQQNTVFTNGYITNTAAGATITTTATDFSLSTMTIEYEKGRAAQSFVYRINGGEWTTVGIAATSTPSIGTAVIDVSQAGSNVALDIQPLNPGIKFGGVIGKVTGNVLIMNKCGIAGATADFFAQNAEWSEAAALLTPNAVLIEFGVNEQIENVAPATFKANVQNIINKVRAITPNCDIILMSPPQTTYETEQPRQYKQADYAKVMSQLSQDNKTAFVNLAIAFGPFSQAQVDAGLMNTDRTHPGAAGGVLIANTIYSALKK